MLADGGYMVGYLAQLLYPTGIEVSGSLDEVIEVTQKHLTVDNIILFEPAIRSGNMIVRIDILIKQGRELKIIEVKSKSFNSEELQARRFTGKTYFDSKWNEYLYDIAYQKMVAKLAYPEYKITCEMLMPDKALVAEIDGLVGMFELIPLQNKSGFRRPSIRFTGTDAELDLIRQYPVLNWVNVDFEIEPLLKECRDVAKNLLSALETGEPIRTQIGTGCRDCEYTVPKLGVDKSGFDLCWGSLAAPKPHILDLTQLGNINKGGTIDALIQAGKTSLYDVPYDSLVKKDGSLLYNGRPYYQVYEKNEFLRDGFKEVVQEAQYPYYFIDFETSQMALPYYKGMRCYENVIFQYSCHKISYEGAKPQHFEWLNTSDSFPNKVFAESLRAVLGISGSLFIWSQYEITQLKNVLAALDDQDNDLKSWISTLLSDHSAGNGRFIDLNRVAGDYYFHPFAGGRTSIKVTLPAVLKSTQSDKIKGLLDEIGLLGFNDDGTIKDPYKLLPSEPVIDQEFQINVKHGGAAMRAYQDMLYGVNKNRQDIKNIYIKALLQYCHLDTLAMVIIWEHWNDLHNNN